MSASGVPGSMLGASPVTMSGAMPTPSSAKAGISAPAASKRIGAPSSKGGERELDASRWLVRASDSEQREVGAAVGCLHAGDAHFAHVFCGGIGLADAVGHADVAPASGVAERDLRLFEQAVTRLANELPLHTGRARS